MFRVVKKLKNAVCSKAWNQNAAESNDMAQALLSFFRAISIIKDHFTVCLEYIYFPIKAGRSWYMINYLKCF